MKKRGEGQRGDVAKRVPRDMSFAISASELFANSLQALHRGKKLEGKATPKTHVFRGTCGTRYDSLAEIGIQIF